MPFNLHHGHWNTARTTHYLDRHRDRGLELIYVKNGSVTWDFEGRAVHVPSGHLSYTWPWQAHGARDIRMPPVELYWVLLPLRSGSKPTTDPRFVQELTPLSSAYQGASVLAEMRKRDTQVLKVRSAFRNAFAALVESLQRTKGCPAPDMWGWLILCFWELSLSMREDSASSNSAQLDRIRLFMDEALTQTIEEDWPLDRMAAACNMGRTLFAERTKQLYGDTPIRVLHRKRTDAARQRLRATADDITTIALDLGYASSQRFATVFKQYTAMSPTQYRFAKEKA